MSEVTPALCGGHAGSRARPAHAASASRATLARSNAQADLRVFYGEDAGDCASMVKENGAGDPS